MSWHLADLSGRYTGWQAHLVVIVVLTALVLGIGWTVRAVCARSRRQR